VNYRGTASRSGGPGPPLGFGHARWFAWSPDCVCHLRVHRWPVSVFSSRVLPIGSSASAEWRAGFKAGDSASGKPSRNEVVLQASHVSPCLSFRAIALCERRCFIVAVLGRGQAFSQLLVAARPR
jgi:hypothetical protein